MKITYSLREFYDEVKQLAATKGKDYVSVRVEFNKHNGLEFACYVSGYNWYHAASPEESLKLLKDAMSFTANEDTKNDVEIETSLQEVTA